MPKIRIFAALLVVLFSLTSCSIFGGSPYVTTESQIEQATEVLTEVATVEGAVPLAGIINITNTSWVMLGLLILGWMLPSPGEILRAIFNPIGWLIRTLLTR